MDPTPPPSPKSSPWLLITILSSLLTLIIGIATGLYLPQLISSKPEATAIPEPTPFFIPSPSPDPTANWQTFTISPDYLLGYEGYQIKLPANWVRIEHSSNFQDTETFQDGYKQNVYRIVIKEQKNIYTTLKDATGLSYEVDTLVVDGQPAARVLPRAGSESDYKVLFFSKDSKILYSMELNTPRDGTKIQEGEILFNQLLSTFKFLDQPISATPKPLPSANLIPTTNWKVANAATYSISYPNQYSAFVNTDLINLRTSTNPEPVAVVSVDKVSDSYGTSVGNWFIKSNYDQAHPAPTGLKFIEKVMGKVPATEVFDNANLLMILVAHNAKLYSISGSESLQTLETITSTISFK